MCSLFPFAYKKCGTVLYSTSQKPSNKHYWELKSCLQYLAWKSIQGMLEPSKKPDAKKYKKLSSPRQGSNLRKLGEFNQTCFTKSTRILTLVSGWSHSSNRIPLHHRFWSLVYRGLLGYINKKNSNIENKRKERMLALLEHIRVGKLLYTLILLDLALLT